MNDLFKIKKIFCATLVCLFLLVTSLAVEASDPISSDETLTLFMGNHLVTHYHSLKGFDVHSSRILFIDRESGEVLQNFVSAPFTSLVALEKGYFVGLSYLYAGTRNSGYNFALFSPQGDIIHT